MNDQRDIDSVFSQIIDRFESAGITDSMAIAEHCAFFLLCWYGQTWNSLRIDVFGTAREMSGDSYVSNLQDKLSREMFHSTLRNRFYGADPQLIQPTAPISMQASQLTQVVDLFEILFENISDLGKWFDRIAIPHLFKSMQGGGRYATPRHLIDFMAGVAGLNQSDSVADFACGTGGMLLANGVVKRATGIEISPNMARLALTNLILRGQIQHDLYLGNAFDVASSDSRFIESRFDAVVMNPPFGMRIDPGLVRHTFERTYFGYDFKGNSETVFAALAYEKLKPGGRMAVLVPSGILFSNNRSETFLRQTLVEEGALQAIISLPRDSMQPINNLDTHILYAIKPGKDSLRKNGVWFYRPRYDGFTEGRNRQRRELNDLPLVQAACNVATINDDVQVIPLVDQEKIMGCYVVTEKDLEFTITLLGGGLHKARAFHIAVFEKTAPREIISVIGEEVFRGQSIVQSLPLITSAGHNIVGKYGIQSYEDVVPKSPLDSILLESEKGEIRKGPPNKAHFSTASTNDSELKVTGILLDASLKVISAPFSVSMDKSLSVDKPTQLLQLQNDEKETVAFLIIFAGELDGIQLIEKNGTQLYLCDWNNRNWLFYSPQERRFLFYRTFVNTSSEIKSNQSLRGVVFDIDFNILGIYVNRQEILSTKSRELQPERYWIEKGPVIPTRSTAQILGDIKRNQNKLTSTLDRLLSISEIQALASVELPPPVQIISPSQGLMQGVQQSVWELVLQQVEPAEDYNTPTPFQADDIHSKLTDNASVIDVQRTLELFERMGLIVSVTYEGVPYYRLPTERDILKEVGQ